MGVDQMIKKIKKLWDDYKLSFDVLHILNHVHNSNIYENILMTRPLKTGTVGGK